MNKVKFVLILSFLFSFYFSGCFFFKKDVMIDTADDVEEAIIVDANDQKFVITKEEIFQATSKSDKGGFRQTSGYREYRLTSYDLNTGNIVKRINLGESDDNYHYLLGPSEGLLWYMSIDKKIGLHARDPKTLEIKVSQNDIVNLNPDLKDNLPTPIWYELRKYYGYDINKKLPMISDNSGYIYYLNTKNLKAEKTNKSIEYFKFEETVSTTSMNLDKETYINLNGSPRRHLNIKSKEISEPTFLDGQFLFSSIMMNLADANPEFNAPIVQKRDKRQSELDSLNNLLSEYSDNTSKQAWQLNSLKNNIKYAERDIERFNKEMGEKSGKGVNMIITKDKGIFIIHQSNATDTAKVLISKIIIDGIDVEQKWQTYIPDVFSEPNKVLNKPGFEYVFSKGSPDVSKKRVLFYDNKLVIILMLRAVCIDADNGNIMWDIEL